MGRQSASATSRRYTGAQDGTHAIGSRKPREITKKYRCDQLRVGRSRVRDSMPAKDSMQNGEFLSKVPEVTIGFWIIKVLATTLGETGGDSVTMSWLHADKSANNGGYLIGTGIFLALFVAAVIAQIS